MTDTEKLLASCYEPPVAAHWDGDVLVLTTKRVPSSIHVRQWEGQQRKVYTGEPELFAPPIKDNWQGALCKRIDELCQENERVKQQNAKLRELVSDYSDCLDTALLLASDAGYPVMPARDKFLSLEKRKREMGIGVD